MIPRTFLSTYSASGQQQMVVVFLDNITGLTRWSDYIPVKLAQGGKENSYDNNGFIDVAVVAKSLTSVPFKDYVPVYADTAATDAWQVNFTGYIPYGYSGFGDASLVLDFISNFQAFDSRITFTRASSASYFASNGLLTSATTNTPRLDYNPATLAAQGLLIEEQRVNLLTYSSEFDNAAWTKTNSSITVNVAASPTGNLNADKLVEALDVNLVHQVAQTGVTVTSLATYAATAFVKADTRTRVRIGYLVGGAGGVVADANLSAGTIGAASAFGGGTAVSSSIQALNNGWFRISVVGSGPAGTSGECRLELLDASGNRQYNGDGTSGIYIYGAQLEAGAFATSYAPSVNTFTSRASTGSFFDATGTLQSAAINVARNTYNPANLAAQPFLLLEEARTNLLTYSSDFNDAAWTKTNATVSANVVASPSGSVDADKLIEDTANSTHFIRQNATAVISTSYASTVFLKAAERTSAVVTHFDGAAFYGVSVNLVTGVISSPPVDLGLTDALLTSSVQSCGNGWYRVSITRIQVTSTTSQLRIFTQSGSNGIYTGNGTSGLYIWGAQLEAGAYPTSYIPTTTTALTRAADLSSSAQATRAADVASVNTLSPWYNASEGTLYVDATAPYTVPASSFPAAATFLDGTVNNYILIGYLTSALSSLEVTTAGVAQVGIYPITAAQNRRIAAAYKLNDFSAVSNGGSVVTDTSGTVPTVDRLRLGDRIAGNALNGYLRRITYYPRRLSNAELQTLTT